MKKEVLVAIVLISLIVFVNPELTGDWHKFFQRASRTARYSTLTPTQTQPIGPAGPTAPISYKQPTAPIAPQPPTPTSPTIITAPAPPILESNQNNNCANAVDDDLDGNSDCADSGCAGPPSCQLEHASFVIVTITGVPPYVDATSNPSYCFDNLDNDADGLLDCRDPDCFNICEEGPSKSAGGTPQFNVPQNVALTCNDNRDNDRDGFTDIADPKCAFHTNENNAAGCWDGVDNDNNGLRDCADPMCQNNPLCSEGGAGINGGCFDTIDNDADGFTDCADRDCQLRGICGCPLGAPIPCVVASEAGACSDYLDNDGDWFFDCTDQQDCGKDPACACTKQINANQLGQALLGVGMVPLSSGYDHCQFQTRAVTRIGTTYTVSPPLSTTPTILIETTCQAIVGQTATMPFGFQQVTNVYSPAAVATGGVIDCTQQTNPATGLPYAKCQNGRCV